MAFLNKDFYVGMIVWYTVNQLRRDQRVRHGKPTRDNKPRPFVCYAEEDGRSYWTCFTRTMNRRRDMVDRGLLRYPAGRLFGSDHLIVNDGRNTFAGPIDVFAELSERYDRFKGFERPFLAPQGVKMVVEIVRAAGGDLPASMRPTPAYAQAA